MPLDGSSKKSVRTYDTDGRLHVAVSNISKAMVCPYRGNEIPGAEKLGLEPGKVYQLLRDPKELAKAAPTFNKIPLLGKHVHATADDPQTNHVVGTTGTECRFEDPYLRNSLAIWDGKSIARVENDATRELSASYHYDPDMTPGEFRGAKYDGVMRNIRGNHVALVEDGRAGNDVLVMDAVMTPDDDAGGSPAPIAAAPVMDDDPTYDAEFDESKVKRGEGGKFSTNSSGASEGMAHHAAKSHEARNGAGGGHVARPHARAAKGYAAALEHYEAGRPEEGHAAHKEAEAHGRVAGAREARVKPVVAKPETVASVAEPVAPSAAAPVSPVTTPPPVAPAAATSTPPPVVAKPGAEVAKPGAEAAKPEAAKPEAAKPEAAKPEAAKPEVAKPPNHVQELLRQAGISKDYRQGGSGVDYNKDPGKHHDTLRGLGFQPGKITSTSEQKGSRYTNKMTTPYSHPEGHQASVEQETTRSPSGPRGKYTHDMRSTMRINPSTEIQGSGASQFAVPERSTPLPSSHLRTALAKGGLMPLKSSTTAVKGWHNYSGNYEMKSGGSHHTITPWGGGMGGGARGEVNIQRIGEALTKAGIHYEPHPSGGFKVPYHQLQAKAKDSKLAGDKQLEGMTMKTRQKVALSQRAAMAKGARMAQALLANDASAAGLSALLEALEPNEAPMANPSVASVGAPGGPDETDMTSTPPGEAAGLGDPEDTNAALGEDDDIEGKVRELLTGKLDDADLEMLLKLIRPDGAEPAAEDPMSQENQDPPDDSGEADAGGGSEDDPSDDALPPNLANAKETAPVMKPAMDAAIKAASAAAVAEAVKQTTTKLNAIREAERFVRPWIGDVVVAMDSADAVYALALEKNNVPTKGVHPSAFKSILSLVPKPGDATAGRPRVVAMDAKTQKTLTERFPGLDRVRVMG